jgi:predicted SAM-dependent methyltransferase
MKNFIKSLIKRALWFFWRKTAGPLKISSYQRHLKPGEPLKIIFGGHWKKEEDGWLIMNEREQDITERLRFGDEVADVIFTEHVVEHLSLSDAIFFFKEAKRILKKGGVMRTVCPMLEKMLAFDENNPLTQAFVSEGVMPNFVSEEKVLKEIGLSMSQFPKTIFFQAEYLKCGHKFIWSARMMKAVLEGLGFSYVEIGTPGEGKYAIERRVRGLIRADGPYDPEGMVVEAIKQ